MSYFKPFCNSPRCK